MCLEDWDDSDGKYTDEQVVEEEEVFGVVRKGVWKLLGKKGHFKYEGFDKTEVEHTREEEAGRSSLTPQAIAAKEKALLAGFNQREEERAKVAVEAPAMTAADILSLAGLGVSGGRVETPQEDVSGSATWYFSAALGPATGAGSESPC